MATIEAQCFQIVATRQCMSSSRNIFSVEAISFGFDLKVASFTKLTSASNLSVVQNFQCSFSSSTMKCKKVAIKAMAESCDKPVSGLPIDLRGKRAFITGVANDNGYGWAIALLLLLVLRFLLEHGFLLPDGSLMEITKIYPLDAIYDSPEDAPEDVKANKHYAGSSK